MAKECYYFRHKLDQGLFVYLEIGDSWEVSFLMEYRITDVSPHFIKTGAFYENRNVLLAFKSIGLSNKKNVLEDKKLEWIQVEPDNQLLISTKTFVDSFVILKRI